jgi:hypothetical protein
MCTKLNSLCKQNKQHMSEGTLTSKSATRSILDDFVNICSYFADMPIEVLASMKTIDFTHGNCLAGYLTRLIKNLLVVILFKHLKLDSSVLFFLCLNIASTS